MKIKLAKIIDLVAYVCISIVSFYVLYNGLLIEGLLLYIIAMMYYLSAGLNIEVSYNKKGDKDNEQKNN